MAGGFGPVTVVTDTYGSVGLIARPGFEQNELDYGP